MFGEFPKAEERAGFMVSNFRKFMVTDKKLSVFPVTKNGDTSVPEVTMKFMLLSPLGNQQQSGGDSYGNNGDTFPIPYSGKY